MPAAEAAGTRKLRLKASISERFTAPSHFGQLGGKHGHGDGEHIFTPAKQANKPRGIE